MTVPRFGWALSEYDETWASCGDARTREEAAAVAFAAEPEALVVWTCVAKPVDLLPVLMTVDGQMTVEWAWDAVGDVAPWVDDDPFQKSPEALADLDERLREAYRGWMAAFPPDTPWQAEEMRRHERSPSHG